MELRGCVSVVTALNLCSDAFGAGLRVELRGCVFSVTLVIEKRAFRVALKLCSAAFGAVLRVDKCGTADALEEGERMDDGTEFPSASSLTQQL